jgi:hypothetical protein
VSSNIQVEEEKKKNIYEDIYEDIYEVESRTYHTPTAALIVQDAATNNI